MSNARRFGGAGIRRGIRSARTPAGVVYIGPAYDDAAWTFTRASEAAFADPREGYAFEASGAAAWLADDVPRVLTDGAVLIEEARTNLVTYSADHANFSGGGLATITAGDGVGPDGSAAGTLTDSAATLDGNRRYSAILSTADPVVSSVYVEKVSGDEASIETAGTSVDATVSVGGGFERLSVVKTGTANKRVELYNADGGSGGAFDTGEENRWWGMQMEAAAFATSPIRTSGATVTRAADALTLPGGDWDEAINSTGFEIDIWPGFASTTAPTRSEIVTVDTGTEALYLSGASLSLAGATFTPIALTFSAHQKLTIRVDWAAQELTVTGATTGDATGALGSTSWGMTQATDDLYVGRSPTAGRVFNGAISRMRPL